jgi:hypothetical protein
MLECLVPQLFTIIIARIVEKAVGPVLGIFEPLVKLLSYVT